MASWALTCRELVPAWIDIHYTWAGAILGASVRFFSRPPFDPELYVLKDYFVKAVGENIRNKVHLDKWVSIASVTSMSLEEFLDQDEFWQEALYQTVSKFVEEQNKAQQKTLDSVTSKLEAVKPYSSPLASMTKPSFQMP